jgi:hypothetical protein
MAPGFESGGHQKGSKNKAKAPTIKQLAQKMAQEQRSRKVRETTVYTVHNFSIPVCNFVYR